MPVKVDRADDHAACGIHEARCADADAEDRPGGGGKQDFDQLIDLPESDVAARCWEGNLGGGYYFVAEVDHSAAEACAAEVEADQVAGIVHYTQEDRGASTYRLAHADFFHQAALVKLGDHLGDAGAGQVGEASYIGTANPALVINGFQDEVAVVGSGLPLSSFQRLELHCHHASRDTLLVQWIYKV